MTLAEPAASPQVRLPFPLQDGETIVTVCRRHWIFFWPMLVAQFLAAVVPAILLAVLLDALGWLDGTVARIFYVLVALNVLYWGVRIALTWYRYRNDIWVITTQRLIDSHRRHPFDLAISTADLVNVQDMTVKRTGVLSTLFDFGSVVCQTASIDQDFVINRVPNPRAIQALVDRERDRERARFRGIRD